MSPKVPMKWIINISLRMLVCASCIGLLLSLASCGGGSNANPPNLASPLEVVNTSPLDNAVGVPLDNSITVSFSAELDPLTVKGSTFGLTLSGRNIPVTFSVAGDTATIIPSEPFSLHSIYTLTASTGIKDRAGNGLTASYAWSFTTRDGSWGAQERIGIASITLAADAPQVAVNRDADAIAVWSESVGISRHIWANRYVASSGWETAQRIELDDSGDGSLSQVEVGIDAAGNAIAVWTQWSGTTNLWANRYVSGSGWQTAQLIETDNGIVLNPQIAMNSTGNAIVTWLRYNPMQPDESSILTRQYEVGNGWGTVQILVGAGRPNYAPVAMDAVGNAIAVWEQWDGTRYDISASQYSPGTGWRTPQRIETNDGNAVAPAIVMDPYGNAMATWHQSDGVRNHVWAVRYDTGAGWGAAQQVDSDDSLDANYPQVAMDGNGNAIVGWYAYDGANWDTWRTWANLYSYGIGWGTPKLLNSDNVVSSRARVAMDLNGNAISLWLQWGGTGFNLWAIRFGKNSGWGVPQLIESTDGAASGSPEVVVAPGGSMMVVWPQSDGVSTGTMWATWFD